MIVDHRQGHLQSLRSVLSTLVYPLQYIVSLPIELSRDLSTSVVRHKTLLEENERLRQAQLTMNFRLQRYRILEQENKRLRALLESSIDFKEKVLVAELLEVEMEPLRQQIVINKGYNEGVFDGQPVVDAGGVMGQIIHVGAFSSTVLLVTDPGHALPVQLNRNGLRAIAVGTGRDHVLLLEHLPTNADIKEGDFIVSSGLGRRFPRGYPVGIVANIELEPGEPFAKVRVTPSARPGQSREVLLVWPYENRAVESDLVLMR